MIQLMTFSMLTFLMERKRKCWSYETDNKNNVIENWKIWDRNVCKENEAYLINKDDLIKYADDLQGKTVICAKFDGELPKGISILMIDEIDTINIVNILQEIFSGYLKWMDACEKILTETNDINKVIELSSEYLDVELCMVDDDHMILGACKNSRFFCYDELGNKQDYMKLDIINMLTQEEEYRTVKEYKEVFIYPKDSLRKNDLEVSYCYNIFLDEEYYARLVMIVKTCKNLNGSQQFLRYIGHIFEKYFNEYSEHIIRGVGKKEFYENLKKLLLHEVVEEEVIKKVLNYKKWKISDSYRVFRMEYLSNISKAYYCKTLEQYFKNCIAVSIDNTIYCVQNLSITLENNDRLPDNFSIYLRECLCRAGISNTGENIFCLYQCKKEADIALDIGTQDKPSFWYYWFHDYMMEYFRKRIIGELNIERLVHPAFKILIDYDRKNDAELLKTLKYFLECNENSTHAAKKLFIHRTTLIHRMDKIKKLTGLDLNHKYDKLHLRLSFYLLETDATFCSEM